MTITCSPALPADMGAVLDMMRTYYQSEGLPFDSDKSRAAVQELMDNKSRGELVLICGGGMPVGYYCLTYGFSLEHHGRDCFLDEIFVRASCQNQGIGTRVLNAITDHLRSQDFRALHLVVRTTNRKAVEFYVRNGFVEQGTLFMTRNLAPPGGIARLSDGQPTTASCTTVGSNSRRKSISSA